MIRLQRKAAVHALRGRYVLMSGLVLAGLACASEAPAALSAIEQAVRAQDRTADNTRRDAVRHPAEELAFFGLTPQASVVEIWPGRGYWTQILAPLLHDQGTYYAALGSADGDQTEAYYARVPGFAAMLAAKPEIYGRVHLTTFSARHPDLAPAGSADVVLTFRNLHNWMDAGDAEMQLGAINRALKPGGVLGIEDHRASTRAPQDAKAANGYVRQDYAISLIEKAGFRFAGASEMDANPRDTADWPHGVWTLPPTYALGQVDRAKYQAVGEADNFVLKFIKVGG